MTQLNIVPNYDKKTARIVGVIAAGEFVNVKIAGFDGPIDGLRLRVLHGIETIARFPNADGDAWTKEGENISCVLDLNTFEARWLLRWTQETSCLFCLEDRKNQVLYFTEEHEIGGWPSTRSDDRLVSVRDCEDRLSELVHDLKILRQDLNAHREDTNNPHLIVKEELGLGKVDNTADAEKPVSSPQRNAINAVLTALNEEVVRATAEGVALSRSIFNETQRAGSEERRLSGIISEEVERATTEDARLRALILAVKQLDIVLADALPVAGPDYARKLYFVPSKKPDADNIKDEFICIEHDGVWSWEQIGSTEIDLSGYAKKEEVPTKLSQLKNDSGFLTEHQDISVKRDKYDDAAYGREFGVWELGGESRDYYNITFCRTRPDLDRVGPEIIDEGPLPGWFGSLGGSVCFLGSTDENATRLDYNAICGLIIATRTVDVKVVGSLAKKADVDKKLDGPTDSDLSTMGRAADAKVVGDILDGKRDKDDLAVYRKVFRKRLVVSDEIRNLYNLSDSVPGVPPDDNEPPFYLDWLVTDGKDTFEASGGPASTAYYFSRYDGADSFVADVVTDVSFEPVADDRLATTKDIPSDTKITELAEDATKVMLPYALVTVDETHPIADRSINTTTSGTFVMPKDFTDILIRFNGTPVGIDWATNETGIADIRGDEIPSESGDYLITITRTKAAEAYVRIINIAKE